MIWFDNNFCIFRLPIVAFNILRWGLSKLCSTITHVLGWGKNSSNLLMASGVEPKWYYPSNVVLYKKTVNTTVLAILIISLVFPSVSTLAQTVSNCANRNGPNIMATLLSPATLMDPPRHFKYSRKASMQGIQPYLSACNWKIYVANNTHAFASDYNV